jgi:triosephosphate isomerase
MEFPVLFVNFKTYERGTAANAEVLARVCERIASKTEENIIPVAQIGDLYRVSRNLQIPIYAQTIDPIKYGSNTGHILPEDIVKNGAEGVVINHSEHRREVKVIGDCINRAQEVGLKTMVCADTAEKIEAISAFDPDLLAIEPPELIGGDVSVSSAEPSLISHSVEKTDIPVICGAGIKTSEDVEKALKLGAEGIFVASGIVEADNPEEEIEELVGPF